MSVPLKGPKLNPAITPITEVGIPGTAHMIAVKKTNNSAAEKPCERIRSNWLQDSKIIEYLFDILDTNGNLPVGLK